MPLSLLPTFVLAAVLQTCINAEPVSFQFTDNSTFYDLSLYNFYLGRNITYEYILTARNEKQVHLYLFQNDQRRYSLNVFDGTDDKAPALVVRDFIPKNDKMVEQPEPISSSGRNMFIRVTADNSDPTASVDFQAMATDIDQIGCSSMVTNINGKDKYTTLNFAVNTSQECYFVLHANDPTNDPLLAQSIQNGAKIISTDFNVYKGLSENDNLATSETFCSASDKYILLNLNQSVNLIYRWTILEDIDTKITINQFTTGTLMTKDFSRNINPTLPNKLTQTFIIEVMPSVTVVRLTFLRFLGSSSISIADYATVDGEPQLEYYYAENDTTTVITYYTTVKLIVTYSTKNSRDERGSGFYGLYEDASEYNDPPEEPISTTIPQTDETTAETSAEASVSTTVLPNSKATISIKPTTKLRNMTTSNPTSDIATEEPSTVSTLPNDGVIGSTSETKKPDDTARKSANDHMIFIILVISTLVMLL